MNTIYKRIVENLDIIKNTEFFDYAYEYANMDVDNIPDYEYYTNNIYGTLVLVDVMRNNGCKSIVFSSSATVYGDPALLLPCVYMSPQYFYEKKYDFGIICHESEAANIKICKK